MSKEEENKIAELLKPRIIVENLYPNCPFQALEIICEPSAQQAEWANKYPYIFRWLNWYEDRKEDELPEYVKIAGEVRKVIRHCVDVYYYKDFEQFNNEGIGKYYACKPATQSEYNNQNNSK